MADSSLDGATHENPLLAYGELPRFDAIRSEHVVPAVRQVLGEQTQILGALERELAPTWEGLVVPLARMGDRLTDVWGVVQHLMGVCNSDALREAHDEVQAEVVTFALQQGQSRPIYDGLCALRDSDGFSQLEVAQRRVVESLIRDARHAGVGLEATRRERFNEIAQEMAELATRFSNHVLDATSAYSMWLRDPADIEGLPSSLIELAAQAAREGGEENAAAGQIPGRRSLITQPPGNYARWAYSQPSDASGATAFAARSACTLAAVPSLTLPAIPCRIAAIRKKL